MIAPLRQSERPRRRRTPLHAARLAVADALLESRPRKSVLRGPLARWHVWLLVGGLTLIAIAYLLSFQTWSVEAY